jgi:putative ABC transport system permease protein
MSYAVNQRRREIAIRMALGAQPSNVLKMIVGEGIVLVAGGVAVGLVAAFGLTRLFRNLLYGIGPTDPLSFVLGSLWVIAFMLVASYVPTRKAITLDPSAALRGD